MNKEYLVYLYKEYYPVMKKNESQKTNQIDHMDYSLV